MEEELVVVVDVASRKLLLEEAKTSGGADRANVETVELLWKDRLSNRLKARSSICLVVVVNDDVIGVMWWMMAGATSWVGKSINGSSRKSTSFPSELTDGF